MRKFLSAVLLTILLLTTTAALAEQPKPSLTDVQLAVNARYVNLGEIRVTDINELIRFIDAHPGLSRIDMFESRLKAEEIDLLAERYPDIKFGWTIRLVDEHYIRTDATAYANNHNKRSELHKSSDFRQLKYCTELRALDLGHNAIDDISFIEDLTELRVIILAGNFITDISPLKKLEKLEYAELFNNYIEDYSPLSGLENLIDLNICFNQTQDFTPLYGLKGLERLWVYNSNNRNSNDPVNPELVADLQAQLPQCQINSTSYSTAGGWRTHERYYVVFNMLHGAVAWLPWHAEGLVPRYN